MSNDTTTLDQSPPTSVTSSGHERLVQIGMRAVIRDVQDFINDNQYPNAGGTRVVVADELHAYLLACLVTAGLFDKWPDHVES